MKWQRIWNVLRNSVNEFLEDKALRLSAALAYYSIFSIAPLLIIVMAVAGFFMGQEAVRGQIQEQLRQFVGEQGTQAIVSMVGAHKQGSSLAATIAGIIVLLFGASGVFGQLQDSLDVIWEVQPKPGLGLWGFVRSRFLSFSMVLVIGFLLLISMVITTVLTGLTGALGQVLPMPEFLAHAVNFIASFVVVTLLFAMIYKVLPDAKVKWRHVWSGATFTALLFTIGKYLLAIYLGRATTASSYGAAGSLVVVLLWIYYSSVILFFWAEFTQVYARATGSRIVPSKDAIPLTEEVREQQGMPRPQRPGPTGKAIDSTAESGTASIPVESGATMPKSPKEVFQEVAAENRWRSIPKTREILRERPWPYLGLALGFGMATGWVVKRDAVNGRGFFKAEPDGQDGVDGDSF